MKNLNNFLNKNKTIFLLGLLIFAILVSLMSNPYNFREGWIDIDKIQKNIGYDKSDKEDNSDDTKVNKRQEYDTEAAKFRQKIEAASAAKSEQISMPEWFNEINENGVIEDLKMYNYYVNKSYEEWIKEIRRDASEMELDNGYPEKLPKKTPTQWAKEYLSAYAILMYSRLLYNPVSDPKQIFNKGICNTNSGATDGVSNLGSNIDSLMSDNNKESGEESGNMFSGFNDYV